MNIDALVLVAAIGVIVVIIGVVIGGWVTRQETPDDEEVKDEE